MNFVLVLLLPAHSGNIQGTFRGQSGDNQ
jgi:hypothetical protein